MVNFDFSNIKKNEENITFRPFCILYLPTKSLLSTDLYNKTKNQFAGNILSASESWVGSLFKDFHSR